MATRVLSWADSLSPPDRSRLLHSLSSFNLVAGAALLLLVLAFSSGTFGWGLWLSGLLAASAQLVGAWGLAVVSRNPALVAGREEAAAVAAAAVDALVGSAWLTWSSVGGGAAGVVVASNANANAVSVCVVGGSAGDRAVAWLALVLLVSNVVAHVVVVRGGGATVGATATATSARESVFGYDNIPSGAAPTSTSHKPTTTLAADPHPTTTTTSSATERDRFLDEEGGL